MSPKNTPKWRIAVSKVEKKGFEYEITGALASDGSWDDSKIWHPWTFNATTVRARDALWFHPNRSMKETAAEAGVPKYVAAAITGMCRAIAAAERRNVQLPIDFFDPCVAKGQRDEVHCSPESE